MTQRIAIFSANISNSEYAHEVKPRVCTIFYRLRSLKKLFSYPTEYRNKELEGLYGHSKDLVTSMRGISMIGAENFISFLSSIASLVLSVVAIWLSLYHKKEADETNKDTREVLLQVKTDANTIANVALPELQKYGDAARNLIMKNVQYDYTYKSSQEMPKLDKVDTDTGVVRTSDHSGILNRLHILSEEMEARPTLSVQQRDLAMRLLRQIHNLQYRDDPDFLDDLEKVLDALAATDQHNSIQTIDELFGEVLMDHSGIVQTMTAYYGNRLLGDESPQESIRSRFSQYVSAAKNLDVYGIAMPRLFVLAHEDHDVSRIEKLFEELQDMTDRERSGVVSILFRYATPQLIARQTNSSIQRMSRKFASFLKDYRDRLESAAKSSDQTVAEDI